MNYELYFYCLIAFILGRLTKWFNIYIGPDETKYSNATIGILLKS